MNLKQQQKLKETDIAVIGLGFRLPGDNNEPVGFWNNLKSGFDAVDEIQSERWSENFSIIGDINSNKSGQLNFDDWKNFDPLFFGITPNEMVQIDPQQRLSLISTWEALEDAYLDPIELRGTNTSVFMGCYSLDYKNGLDDRNHTKLNTLISNMHSLSNRISYCFDFRGQSVSVDTACSASSNAIISGCRTLIDGSSSLSICGGTNFIFDTCFSKAITIAGMDSKNGKSMSFDESASGFVRSEGCGIVILKRLSDAIKDGNKIYCSIKGFSSNTDGNFGKGSFLAPSINGQFSNIGLAFKSTDGTVKPNDIYYVEAHGTGTPVGDPIELEAISMALKTTTSRSTSSPLFVGSLKSNIGHTESASGVASLIKCCLLFKHRKLTPNINFNKPNPRIKFDEWNLKVVTKVTPFPINKQVSMMINNFGATGSNCCFILSEFIQDNNNNNNNNINNNNNNEYLIPFSANSKKSLEKYNRLILNNYVGKIDFNELVLKQIFTKTTQLGQRSVIISKSNWEGFNDKNQQYHTQSNKSSNVIIKSTEPTIVFIFPGQGPQFNRMGLELYEKEVVFRDSINEINELFKKYYGYSVLDKLRNIDNDDKHFIHLPTIAQPSIIMIQISLFRLLKHWNINPSFIIGHCFGEIASSFCSGMIDLETCVRIAYHRSTLQDKLVGTGKMLSVNISEHQYNEEYSKQYPLVEIACYNSFNSIVVSGSEDDLMKLSSQLKLKSIFNVLLGTKIGYHSESLNEIKDELISTIGTFKSNPPTIPIFSTVSSELFYNEKEKKQNTIFDSDYIFKSSREPVMFKEAISNLYSHIETNNIGNGSVTFIEITSHPALSFYLNEMIPQNSNFFDKDSITILQTLNRKKNDIKEIQKVISTLYCQGYNINFKCQFKDNQQQQQHHQLNKLSIDLPRYQWDLQSYWYECEENYKNRIEGPPITILGNSNDLTSPFTSRTTFIDISKEPFQWLKGHLVKEKFYFPGCGYIDNIINLFPNQDIIIEQLKFEVPFILTEGKNLEMTTNIIPISTEQRNVYFHIKDQKSNEWVQSSNGLLSTSNSNINNDSIKIQFDDIELLKNQFSFTHLLKSDFYNHIKRVTSISYSGCFQRVEECWIGKDNSSLIKVSTKQLLSKSDDQVFLNASILDCCLHGTLFTTINDPCPIVFERIEDFKFYSSNIPLASTKQLNEKEEQFIYVISKKSDGGGGGGGKTQSSSRNSFSGSMVAFLENGQILFEAKRVICTSLVPVIDSTLTEYPTDELHSFYLESKDSQIENLNSFQGFYESKKYLPDKTIDFSIYNEIIPKLFYKHISNRIKTITIKSIKNNSIDQLMDIYLNKLNSKHSRLLKFVFETLKSFTNVDQFIGNEIDKNDTVLLVLLKSTKIISKLLFPLEDDDSILDTPQTLFEDGLLDKFYSNTYCFEKTYSLISDLISKSIKPLLKERMVFRILELGGGTCSLSEMIIKSINQLLNQNNNNQDLKILIEFTYTDISSSFIPAAKNKLYGLINNENESNISLLFKTFDLEILYSKQSYNPSYYDIVTFTNVLHVVKDLKFGLEQIYNVLKPNGHLIFVEPPKSLVADSIFGCFHQWWAFTDSDIRNDRCCMNQDNWFNLLSSFGLSNIFTSNSQNSTIPFILHTQKQPLLSSSSLSSSSQQQIVKSPEEFTIIFYTSEKENSMVNNFKNSILNQLFKQSQIKTISTVNEFKKLNIPNDDKSIIFFLPTIKELKLDDFNDISFELYSIGKYLLDNNLFKPKLALISTNSQKESISYLNSSVLGVMKYFEDGPLSIFSFDYDNESISNELTTSTTINSLLLNSHQHIQIEYIIRRNKVQYERIYRESIYKTFKNRFDDKLNINVNCNFGKTILITGQTGIILEVLKWIVSNSTTLENIIILSFSKLKWELKLFINQTIEKSNKIKFHFKDVDVGNEVQLNNAIDDLYRDKDILPPVDSIFHFAFVMVVKKLNEIDIEDFKTSSSAKVNGAINLHNISLQRNWNIKNFVLSSSIASVVSHVGAPSYCSSNNVLDSFSRYRKSIGLPCTTINMGFIKSTGKLVLANNKSVSDSMERNGIIGLKTNLIFGTIDLLSSGSNDNNNNCDENYQSLYHNSFLSGFNYNVAASYLNNIKFSYKLDYYTNQISKKSTIQLENKGSEGISNFLINTISDLLSIEPSMINDNFKFVDYGADSLHSTLFKNVIEKQFFSGILTTSQIQSLSIKSMIQIVTKSVNEKQ
ncbi:hypothetical protein ACTA71_007274 [Dictyostelium dimigraforme]